MAISRITPQPGILDIAPYVGGEAKVEGVNSTTKLSSNENPFGPSPKAIEAAKDALETMGVYPSSDHFTLRDAIGNVHNIDPKAIIIGAGSDEIISFLCQTYAGPGDEVLYTEHGFAMYRISALAAGATPVVAPETHRTTDIDALINACTERTRLVFIANPNNPTGTMISQSEVERLAEGIPENCLLVLDGAYVEYVDDPDFDGGLALAKSRNNVVVTRTFSKIYGLGAMRVGWGFGPDDVIDALNRVRGPFNVTAPSLAAAEAAIIDQSYIKSCLSTNKKLRDTLRSNLLKLGLEIDESHANFLLVRFASQSLAEACDEALKQNGLIVRKVAGYGFPEALRITIGDEIACNRVTQVISHFMETHS